MHTRSTCFSFLLSICLFQFHHVIGNNITQSCKDLYQEGVEAYLENRFHDCISLIEEALHAYHNYIKYIQKCRLECHEDANNAAPLHPINVENLLFYEKAIVNTLCLIKCKMNNDISLNNYNVDAEVVKVFEDRKPYDYLQACYIQAQEPQKAASAAFTYLVKNPNDDIMIRNLKYYATLPEVEMVNVINYEAKDYVYLYVHGTDAYDKKRWDDVIANMEESVSSYLQAEEECRVQCEGPFNQNWYPDFIPAVANHFAHCLQCKRECKQQLSTLNGEKHDDLFASHYHYLQYAYFKVGNVKAACAAVSSYLLFYPFDETMQHNMDYYKKLPKVNADDFKPRMEAVTYYHRNKYEEKIMEYIFSMFTSEIIDSKEGKMYGGLINFTNKRTRFTLDDFISERECKTLLETAKNYSVIGDGYTGKMSPHTIHENYEGLSVNRLAKLVSLKLLDRQLLNLFLKISGNVKNAIEDYFQVTKRLHFTYTHLVCRSAISGFQKNRSDFSHRVHADNCNIKDDGSCTKISPAFTWRDFTAILYLNGDFLGGDLFFSRDYYGKEIEQTIQPICGRLVGFTSGAENLHGVSAITEGTRCALAIWFTYDVRNVEADRKLLYNMLGT